MHKCLEKETLRAKTTLCSRTVEFDKGSDFLVTGERITGYQLVDI
jgi:hypothetical protein